jgi:hypothetical protein
MLRSVRRVLACFVILAIAVQAAFAAPIASAPSQIDPLSFICHSDSGAPAAADEKGAPAAEHSCCDSCILCHATPAANGPDEASYLIPRPRPARIALTPASEPPRAAVFHQAFARGPPSSV